MILYHGLNPVTVFPGTPAAGYGFFPGPLETQGGDKRSSANLNAAVESLTSRTNFLGWRTINIVDGGTYTFISTVNVGNAWHFTNAGWVDPSAVFNIQGTMNLGSGLGGAGLFTVGSAFYGIGHVLVSLGSDITVQAGGTVAVSGSTAHPTTCTFNGDGSGPHCTLLFQNKAALTLDATSILTCNGPAILAGATTQTGAYTQSGAGAFRVPRTHTISALTVGLTIADARAFDIIYIITGDDGVTTTPLTINSPAAGTPLGVVVRVCQPGSNQVSSPTNSFHLQINTGGYQIFLTNAASGSGSTILMPVWVDLMVAEDANNGGALFWSPIAGTGLTLT